MARVVLSFTIVELDSQPPAPPASHSNRRPLRKRPLLWILLSLAGLVVVLAAMFTAAVPLSSDALRHRIVRTLSYKLDSDVELGDLHLRVWPTMRVEGADLRIRRRGAAVDTPPLISITSFHVDASHAGALGHGRRSSDARRKTERSIEERRRDSRPRRYR